MPKVDGFVFDVETGNLTLYAGDTGSYAVRVTRTGGEPWPETARLLYTVKNSAGDIVMQRLYRLDDQWDLGDGVILVEYHNDDTDAWSAGMYSTEIRVDLAPVWEGTPSEARCVNQLGPGAAAVMVEGIPVRTLHKGTLTINSVDGRI